jgi:hypothetical protein
LTIRKKADFALPDLATLMVLRKLAVLAGKGIHPFTNQEQMFKVKPARNVGKAVSFKAFKDMIKQRRGRAGSPGNPLT